MHNNPARKPDPAHTGADTAPDTPPAPAGTSILRQTGRTALLSLAATPAPILIAIVDWWLKTH
ncbi:hypothetical protein ACFWA9_04230 [Kitasatospora sp. NPDC059973]|uniref:hypothetical protein n=1 Tax=Kitasatospora sp. NPDC059973 TaxID=3347020 RepID=UPI0036CA15DE